MGLPQTLTGMVGFIIFVGFMVSLAYEDLNPNNPAVQIQKSLSNEQKSMQNVFGGLNQSTNGTTPDSSTSLFSFTKIINFFIFLFYLPLEILAYVGIITVVLSDLPPAFQLLNILIIVGLLIAIYKAIRAHTE